MQGGGRVIISLLYYYYYFFLKFLLLLFFIILYFSVLFSVEPSFDIDTKTKQNTGKELYIRGM